MAPKTMKKMKTAVSWFEIPAKKLSRAKKFYEALFEIEMQDLDMGNELKMTMFPVEEGGIGGALCEHKDWYKPSMDGALVYLSANPDLQTVLNKVEKNGGKILRQKSKISDEYGYMAIFQDTEGNRLALHSMK
ncbi:MAG TPA: VOC family protein [Balneolaceae bacterium]|nr:VOC family protein [Balneolaceae bacterium]